MLRRRHLVQEIEKEAGMFSNKNRDVLVGGTEMSMFYDKPREKEKRRISAA